jgi:DNA-binding LacI/PurR family transcriptional regulator
MASTLDGERGGPLYQQLKRDLFARIRRREFSPGDLLPSERQLCEEYRVSTITARRALLELVKEGLVRRRAGVGTIVSTHLRTARLSFVNVDYVGDAWREVSAVMGELIAGIGETVWQRDASFATACVDEDASVEYLRELARSGATDGVLLRTANDVREEQLRELEEAGLPYVAIKRELARRPMNCVVSDDYQGAGAVTRHLLELGHRRVAFVCAKPQLTLTQERLAGYRDALLGANLPFDETLVRLEPSFTRAAGERAVRWLLGMVDRPSAIFIASDTMALGGYQAARELGLEIPGQVALAGYDDIAPAALMTPPLTTVRTSYYEFGRRSAELLLDLIDGRCEPPQRIVIRPELVIRGSTGGPPSTLERPLPRRPDGPVPALGPTPVQVLGDREAVELVTRGLAAEGIEVATGQGPDLPGGAVLALDARRGVERALRTAAGQGEAIARSMATRLGGALVVVALSRPQIDPATSTGVRAGLRQVTESLSERWRPRGVRVNGVWAGWGDPSTLAGPCRFLLSPDATHVSGQVLVVG